MMLQVVSQAVSYAASARRALGAMLRSWKLTFLAATVAAGAFLFAIYLSNLGLLRQLLFSPEVSFATFFSVLAGLLGSIRTNFTIFSAATTAFVSLLLGLNTALLVQYFSTHRVVWERKSALASVGGFVSAVVGVGCAACGSLVLTSLLGTAGAAGALAFLPFDGGEFNLLAAGLLIFSIGVTAKKIEAPLVC